MEKGNWRVDAGARTGGCMYLMEECVDAMSIRHMLAS